MIEFFSSLNYSYSFRGSPAPTVRRAMPSGRARRCCLRSQGAMSAVVFGPPRREMTHYRCRRCAFWRPTGHPPCARRPTSPWACAATVSAAALKSDKSQMCEERRKLCAKRQRIDEQGLIDASQSSPVEHFQTELEVVLEPSPICPAPCACVSANAREKNEASNLAELYECDFLKMSTS